MCGIGRETALGFQRAFESVQQAVYRLRDGADFVRQPGGRDGCKVTAAARLDSRAEASDRRHRYPHDAPDPDQTQRNNQAERQRQPEQYVPCRLATMRKRLSGCDSDLTAHSGIEIDAVGRRVGEAHAGERWEHG